MSIEFCLFDFSFISLSRFFFATYFHSAILGPGSKEDLSKLAGWDAARVCYLHILCSSFNGVNPPAHLVEIKCV